MLRVCVSALWNAGEMQAVLFPEGVYSGPKKIARRLS
jgi:hypothetical protein